MRALLQVLASRERLYLVLEYVPGGMLFDEIARAGRFSEDKARKYFRELVV